MRITKRNQESATYWASRWGAIAVDAPMSNDNSYPLVCALRAIQLGDSILEAGCGNGRILRALHHRGHRVEGCDFIQASVEMIDQVEPEIPVRHADVRQLPYEDARFDVVLAFGVIHGLETGVDRALLEFYRVLRPGGMLVISARANNLNTLFADALWSIRNRSFRNERFHKFNSNRDEFRKILASNKFRRAHIESIDNFPLFYRFPWLRERQKFSEQNVRRGGYQLNGLGTWLTSVLEAVAPGQTHSLWVAYAQKPALDELSEEVD